MATGRQIVRRELLASGAGLVMAAAAPASGAANPTDRADVVTVAARPEAFDFTPRRAAVLVIDMQNDFASPGGMFDRAGIDIGKVRQAVGPTARVLSGARAHGMPVVYLKMGFLPDLSDAGGPTSPNWIKHSPLGAGRASRAPDGRPSRVLVRDTWNTEIIEALAPHPGDLQVWKHRFSGFFETDLHGLLQARRLDTLVVAGATTSVCVESTLRDAMFHDYRCLLLSDCTAEPIGDAAPRSNYAASLLTIETLFGWVSDSAGFAAALGS
jgi:ureidoacrylate peracid hydrolase